MVAINHTSADCAEVARMLHALVTALPPVTAAERATTRRVEGAAVAVGTLVERR